MLRRSMLIVTLVLGTAGAADAHLVWRGRDGRAYASVRDCFTNNPQCLPETAFVAPAGPGTTPDATATTADARVVSPRDAATGLATGRRLATPAVPVDRAPPIMCIRADRWVHAEPCDAAAGELRVQLLD